MMTRQFFSGGITGSAGTDSVDVFGYINFLKDCDASVQWTLFMPDFAKQQQNGFRVDSFEYDIRNSVYLPVRLCEIQRGHGKDAPP